MKESLFIVLSLVLIIAALIGLNAASYAPLEKVPDDEARPNRSTFNTGATGTRAFYDFLRETNKPVTRWQEKTAALSSQSRTQPKTFVIIGETRRNLEETEIKDLLAWTAAGGRLIIVDREPNEKLLPKSGNWKLEVAPPKPFTVAGDSSNVAEMTKEVVAARSVQPSLLTASVNSVMPSKFAAAVDFKQKIETSEHEAGKNFERQTSDDVYSIKTEDELMSKFSMFAPVVHLKSQGKNILADYNYEAGRIIVLTDPYIISNGGIELADNLRLATNLVANNDGLIAFDEYHQGYGASGNTFLNFFANTPLPAIAAQFAVLIALVIYTRGRRFARALPAPNPDRRSKLEYVAAMAELQRRTKAYDLALENIYGRVRRELARFAGVDNLSTPPHVLAERVAMRSKFKKDELTKLFRDCEDIVHGEQTNDKTVVSLVTRLREIERELGFSRRRSEQTTK